MTDHGCRFPLHSSSDGSSSPAPAVPAWWCGVEQDAQEGQGGVGTVWKAYEWLFSAVELEGGLCWGPRVANCPADNLHRGKKDKSLTASHPIFPPHIYSFLSSLSYKLHIHIYKHTHMCISIKLLLKWNLGKSKLGPAAPPGGADESISSTGDVQTGLLEANSRAYWRTSARGNLLGPDP